jgi:hypothetical protein
MPHSDKQLTGLRPNRAEESGSALPCIMNDLEATSLGEDFPGVARKAKRHLESTAESASFSLPVVLISGRLYT